MSGEDPGRSTVIGGEGASPEDSSAPKMISLAEWLRPQRELLTSIGDTVRQADINSYDHLGWEILFTPLEKNLLRAYAVSRFMPKDWKGLVLYGLLLELRLVDDLISVQTGGGSGARLPTRLQKIYGGLIAQARSSAEKSQARSRKRKRLARVEALDHTLARLDQLGRVVAGQPPPARGEALPPDAVSGNEGKVKVRQTEAVKPDMRKAPVPARARKASVGGRTTGILAAAAVVGILAVAGLFVLNVISNPGKEGHASAPAKSGKRPMDTDWDAVLDTEDNCPTISNPDQMDSNKDGIGDACSPPNPPDPANAARKPGPSKKK